jgi:hypothetical protein
MHTLKDYKVLVEFYVHAESPDDAREYVDAAIEGSNIMFEDGIFGVDILEEDADIGINDE